MGVSSITWAEVGVQVEREHLRAPFKHVEPEVCHYEDRFDPKTGKKVEPKKIVDCEEKVTLHFQGKQYRDTRDLANAVAAHLGCKVTHYNDCVCGQWDTYVFGFDHSAHDEYGPAATDLKPIIDSFPALLKIQQDLIELGIRASNPQLVQCMSVG